MILKRKIFLMLTTFLPLSAGVFSVSCFDKNNVPNLYKDVNISEEKIVKAQKKILSLLEKEIDLAKAEVIKIKPLPLWKPLLKMFFSDASENTKKYIEQFKPILNKLAKIEAKENKAANLARRLDQYDKSFVYIIEKIKAFTKNMAQVLLIWDQQKIEFYKAFVDNEPEPEPKFHNYADGDKLYSTTWKIEGFNTMTDLNKKLKNMKKHFLKKDSFVIYKEGTIFESFKKLWTIYEDYFVKLVQKANSEGYKKQYLFERIGNLILTRNESREFWKKFVFKLEL